jgi:RimJ/RimL family protein N-acetyltransferase
MIVLETPRLLLCHLTLDDLEAVTALYSDSIVMASKGGERSPELIEQQLKGYIEEYDIFGYCFWAVIHRQHQAFIGLCGLLDQQDADGRAEVEVAYTLAKEYWNQGLATEAAQARKDYGFQVLNRSRLVSLIAPENIASQRVALKNGMTYERDFVDKKGRMMRIYAVQRV